MKHVRYIINVSEKKIMKEKFLFWLFLIWFDFLRIDDVIYYVVYDVWNRHT